MDWSGIPIAVDELPAMQAADDDHALRYMGAEIEAIFAFEVIRQAVIGTLRSKGPEKMSVLAAPGPENRVAAPCS